jgi:hypothetical protein
MRLLVLLIAITSVIQAKGLKDILSTNYNVYDVSYVNWEKWQFDVTNSEKKKLISSIKKPGILKKTIDNLGTTNRYFKVIDFNIDGLKDVVFYGKPEGESIDYICFAINNGKNLELVYQQKGHIAKLSNFDGFTPMSFTAYTRSSEGTEDHIYSVVPTIKKSKYSFEIINDIAVYNHLKKPSIYFGKPLAFKTTKNRYSLRTAPKIDNANSGYFARGKGNVIAVYKQGSHGIALAEETDERGRIWWLVAMNVTNKITSYKLDSSTKNAQKYKVMGWMSSSSLQLLDF